MNGPLLEVSDLSVVYRTYEGTVAAVNGLGFSLHRGRTLGLVGESGAGKTTTALSIMGLVPSPPGVVESGRIIFDGQDLLRLPEREMKRIRGNRISMIFQDPMTSLNPVLTVGLQISEALAAHQDLSEAEAERRAAEMLERVQIPAARYREYPHEFSGGMRQRVVIAMALACNPSLIIADEPTTALDVTIQAQVLELMKSLKEEFATSMIMITHDLGVVGEVCDNVAVMYAGRIVETGSLEQVFSDALHPYTRGLFRCIPDIEEELSVIRPIEGLMPEPLDLPSGCAFHPRCPRCMEICRTRVPEAIERDGHGVMCHLFSEGGGGDHA
ncbi:MAG: Oligopeptide transport ATP-binding protein OppD [Synergistetes bacterium ADurb.BinA166]|jgi:peptide/nickel transport system ATP-binding protein|nr:MAG: Oligopeptide transport ATP-binding protein OppD [Synergistetes bacterium ADurb.BinA166]